MFLAGCEVVVPEQKLPPHVVTGTVKVPVELYASIVKQRQATLMASVVDSVFQKSWAFEGEAGGELAVDGSFIPLSDVQVELVRMVYDPVADWYSEFPVSCEGGCPITAIDGTYTVTTLEQPSSDLVLKVTFIDPVDGSVDVVMRAIVYGNTVDITPVSEATTQIVVGALSDYVQFENFTINEIGALVELVEDEKVDIAGLNFADAVARIRSEVSDVLARFIVGFQDVGEMNVAFANDIFNLMEVSVDLISPDLTLTDGAVNMTASLGGAISFDEKGDFQGGALYYWGLRSVFSGDAVRLFDEEFVEEDISNPNSKAWLDFKADRNYWDWAGMRGIVGADNGMAVVNSNTELTSYGFISNDGGIMAFLREKNDESQLVYKRGLRILMKKWTQTTSTYDELFSQDYLDSLSDPHANTNDTNFNSLDSADLNPMMDQNVYNVVQFQTFMDAAGFELGTATGTWVFDNSTPVTVNDGSYATTKPHGQVQTLNMEIDAAKYLYSIGAVIRNQTKVMEPCPNLYQIQDGGSIMLRRDSNNNDCNGSGFNIFAGTGAVSADSEVFVVPQIFDDVEDNILLELPLTGGAGRRGWYIGIKQPVGLIDANVTGIYHVVGQITTIDGGSDVVTTQTLHGNLQFLPETDDGTGSKVVIGTLHSKSHFLDEIIVDAVAPTIAKTRSRRHDVSGSYKVAGDGTFTFALPGITDAVTGAAGQMLTLEDGSRVAMLLVIPISDNSVSNAGGRGIMLLAHEFMIDYPVPPEPPAAPAAPGETAPLPPG